MLSSKSYRRGEVPYEVLIYAGLGKAWRSGQVDSFNEIVSRYRATLEKHPPLASSARPTRKPASTPPSLFYKSLNLYGLAFLLAAFSLPSSERHTVAASHSTWWRLPSSPQPSASSPACGSADTPPVTNLYSSALLVGWGGGRPVPGSRVTSFATELAASPQASSVSARSSSPTTFR
ncbi:MAG: hypothetical protein QM760_11825 [Nibricoccus sp.]